MMKNKVTWLFFIVAGLSAFSLYASYIPLTWEDLHQCNGGDSQTIRYYVDATCRDDYIEHHNEIPRFKPAQTGIDYKTYWVLCIKGKKIEELSSSINRNKVLERFNTLRKQESVGSGLQRLFGDEE